MNIDDERKLSAAETPPEGAASGSGAGIEPGTGSAEPAESAMGSCTGGDAPSDRPVLGPGQQPGWPPAPQPGWPPPGAWPPVQPGWQHPAPSWPAGQQQGWPPAPQQGWQPPSSPGWGPPGAWPPPYQPFWPAFPTAASSGTPDSPGSRPTRARLPLIIAIVAAALVTFSSGMVVDRVVAGPSPAPSPGQTSTSQPLEGFSVYEEALKDIRTSYVGRSSVTDQQLLYGSIKGMVDSLGDTNHTRFLTPEEYAQMTSQLSGKVAGIGVLVTESNGSLIVDRVITDSPADKAGVRAGDAIVAVDGKSTAGWTFGQLAAQVRGDPGTKVTVSVIHAGSTTSVDITITRAEISAPLVDWGMVPGTTVADIALFEFSGGAADQIHRAVASAQKAGATAIVLDLRGNPGGLASEARSVASEFLSTGVIYQEEDASGHRTSIKVDTSRTATSLPMVVLVDHDTASAAEIVAGAFQDNLRAKLVGLTTVGTGTVLQPFVLSDGSVLLLGVSDWLTPSGHRIFGIGIKPDQTVSLPTGGQPIDPIKLDTMSASAVQASGDAQLLAAIKLLGQ